MDPLFPELPEDLTVLSDEELASLLQEHEIAADLIDAEDEDFIRDLEANEVLEQYTAGIEQIEAIVAEQKRRVDEYATYRDQKSELAERRKALLAAEEVEANEDEGDGDGDGDGDEAEEAEDAELAVAEAEETEEEKEEVEEEKEEAVVASNGTPYSPALGPVDTLAPPPAPSKPTMRRRPPPASRDRQLQDENGAVLVAAGGLQDARAGQVLDRDKLSRLIRQTAMRWGPPSKSQSGVEEKLRVASARFTFPEDRILDASDWSLNAERISAILPEDMPGFNGLVASGGLCAPLTPLYSMPNFASQARPVRDALPSFQADRGGVNVPEATIIGDITTAISVIDEAEDALGGTFATKSCQDLTCPAYTETAVTIIAHCREYGNLNARAWPEKIAHENDLTMAAHARTAEQYLLDRIKTQSVNVTMPTKPKRSNADSV